MLLRRFVQFHSRHRKAECQRKEAGQLRPKETGHTRFPDDGQVRDLVCTWPYACGRSPWSSLARGTRGCDVRARAGRTFCLDRREFSGIFGLVEE
jgi:hypothetical protein